MCINLTQLILLYQELRVVLEDCDIIQGSTNPACLIWTRADVWPSTVLRRSTVCIRIERASNRRVNAIHSGKTAHSVLTRPTTYPRRQRVAAPSIVGYRGRTVPWPSQTLWKHHFAPPQMMWSKSNMPMALHESSIPLDAPMSTPPPSVFYLPLWVIRTSADSTSVNGSVICAAQYSNVRWLW